MPSCRQGSGPPDIGTGLPEGLREAMPTPRRLGWANLLARVFAVDVTVCSKCGGREDPRDRHLSARHRQATARSPRTAARRNPVLLDSWGCSRRRAPRGRAGVRASWGRRRVVKSRLVGELVYERIYRARWSGRLTLWTVLAPSPLQPPRASEYPAPCRISQLKTLNRGPRPAVRSCLYWSSLLI